MIKPTRYNHKKAQYAELGIEPDSCEYCGANTEFGDDHEEHCELYDDSQNGWSIFD